jgi:hypothetical protein
LIAIAYASLSPNAMMIHLIDTFLTCTTMRYPGKFVIFACSAVIVSWRIEKVKELVRRRRKCMLQLS